MSTILQERTNGPLGGMDPPGAPWWAGLLRYLIERVGVTGLLLAAALYGMWRWADGQQQISARMVDQLSAIKIELVEIKMRLPPLR